MNASDSEEDSYDERTALVPSENPVLPSYRPEPDLNPPLDPPTKRVKVRFFCVESGSEIRLVDDVLNGILLVSLGSAGGQVRPPWTAAAAVAARIRRRT